MSNTLPNGVVVPDPLEYEVFELYRFRCVNHPGLYANCLHHEPPRSVNPDYAKQPWTWFPVCTHCHETAHNVKRDLFIALLNLNRNRYFPRAKEHVWQNLPAE